MDGNPLMKAFLQKYRGLILYGIFGICTTLVNIATYWLCARVLHLPLTPSTVTAWILSVLFAYFTNRKWVFESQAEGTDAVLKEVLSFFASRLSTGLLDWLIMYLCVKRLGMDDMLVKTAANVLVIVLNYILGKFVVFRKR
jgi:putative flippase GtrA